MHDHHGHHQKMKTIEKKHVIVKTERNKDDCETKFFFSFFFSRNKKNFSSVETKKEENE